MNIYIDVIFVINFIMNALIFYMSKIILKENIKVRYIILISLISTLIYVLVAFVYPFNAINNRFSQLIIICLSIFVLFKPKKIVVFIKEIVIFHVISFIVGGIGLYVLYFFNYENILGDNINFNFNAPIFLFFGLSLMSYFFVNWIHKFIEKNMLNKQTFARIKVCLNNGTAEFNALVDTGNNLRCPITNIPVLVAEFQSIKTILPPKVQLIFFENKDEDITNFVEIIENINIRLIPFRSLGNRRGILLGFIPDKITIYTEKGNINFYKGEGIVGICNFKLSKWDYEGLLNPDFIKNN